MSLHRGGRDGAGSTVQIFIEYIDPRLIQNIFNPPQKCFTYLFPMSNRAPVNLLGHFLPEEQPTPTHYLILIHLCVGYIIMLTLEKVNINLFTLPTLLQLRILGAEVNTGERRMNGAVGPGSRVGDESHLR